MKNSAATSENSLVGFFRKLIFSLCDPAVPLLGINPREMKTYIHTKTCMWLFIAALFIIAETWKQLKCLSTVKWINKM